MANSYNGFKLYQTESGLTPALKWATTGGAVAIGDPLVWASGVLVVHTSGTADATAKLIVGIAQNNAASGEKVSYQPVRKDSIFTAVMSAYTEASNRGVAYELTGATGAYGVNAAVTTTPIVRVIDRCPAPYQNTSDTTMVRVLVKFDSVSD